jgi:hypothetical protein
MILVAQLTGQKKTPNSSSDHVSNDISKVDALDSVYLSPKIGFQHEYQKKQRMERSVYLEP